MAIKQSGSLSFKNDIRAEFGGTTPHSMSEYYRGGSLVRSILSSVIQGTASGLSTTDIRGAAPIYRPISGTWQFLVDAQGTTLGTVPNVSEDDNIFRSVFWSQARNGEPDVVGEVYTFTIDQAGTYTLYLRGFATGDTAIRTNVNITVDGTNAGSLNGSNDSLTFTADANDTIVIQATINATDNYLQGLDVRVEGSLGGRRLPVTQETNTGIPESDTISFSDFYGARLFESTSVTVPSFSTQSFPIPSGAWTTNTMVIADDLQNPIQAGAGNLRISVPAQNVVIRGDEDEPNNPYDSSDNDSIRNPGFVVSYRENTNDSWTVLFTTRGTGTHADDDSTLTVSVPAKDEEVSASVAREFRVQAIADTNSDGGGNQIHFYSSEFELGIETA